MNKILRYSILASLALAVCAAYGQESLLQRNVELIASPNVAADLRLTTGQASEANSLFSTFQTKRSAKLTELESAKPDKADQINSEIAKMVVDLDDHLLALLTAPQKERLLQIGIQQEGSQALTDSLVAEKIGLTPAQRSKIKAILGQIMEAQNEYQSAVAGAMAKIPDPNLKDQKAIDSYYKGKREEIAYQFAGQKDHFEAVKANGSKEILNLMSAAQQKKWLALHGRPLAGQISDGN
ncbi:MAG TPA: hypothetical protein VMI31_08525 [Fimbriimonadaceae bacterium]|nr:hypothetical protein [Fimbriimonadaceae bacterium]